MMPHQFNNNTISSGRNKTYPGGSELNVQTKSAVSIIPTSKSSLPPPLRGGFDLNFFMNLAAAQFPYPLPVFPVGAAEPATTADKKKNITGDKKDGGGVDSSLTVKKFGAFDRNWNDLVDDNEGSADRHFHKLSRDHNEQNGPIPIPIQFTAEAGMYKNHHDSSTIPVKKSVKDNFTLPDDPKFIEFMMARASALNNFTMMNEDDLNFRKLYSPNKTRPIIPMSDLPQQAKKQFPIPTPPSAYYSSASASAALKKISPSSAGGFENLSQDMLLFDKNDDPNFLQFMKEMMLISSNGGIFNNLKQSHSINNSSVGNIDSVPLKPKRKYVKKNQQLPTSRNTVVPAVVPNPHPDSDDNNNSQTLLLVDQPIDYSCKNSSNHENEDESSRGGGHLGRENKMALDEKLGTTLMTAPHGIDHILGKIKKKDVSPSWNPSPSSGKVLLKEESAPAMPPSGVNHGETSKGALPSFTAQNCMVDMRKEFEKFFKSFGPNPNPATFSTPTSSSAFNNHHHHNLFRRHLDSESNLTLRTSDDVVKRDKSETEEAKLDSTKAISSESSTKKSRGKDYDMPVKRVRGRPPGALNKNPKKAKLQDEQQQELRQHKTPQNEPRSFISSNLPLTDLKKNPSEFSKNNSESRDNSTIDDKDVNEEDYHHKHQYPFNYYGQMGPPFPQQLIPPQLPPQPPPPLSEEEFAKMLTSFMFPFQPPPTPNVTESTNQRSQKHHKIDKEGMLPSTNLSSYPTPLLYPPPPSFMMFMMPFLADAAAVATATHPPEAYSYPNSNNSPHFIPQLPGRNINSTKFSDQKYFEDFVRQQYESMKSFMKNMDDKENSCNSNPAISINSNSNSVNIKKTIQKKHFSQLPPSLPTTGIATTAVKNRKPGRPPQKHYLPLEMSKSVRATEKKSKTHFDETDERTNSRNRNTNYPLTPTVATPAAHLIKHENMEEFDEGNRTVGVYNDPTHSIPHDITPTIVSLLAQPNLAPKRRRRRKKRKFCEGGDGPTVEDNISPCANNPAGENEDPGKFKIATNEPFYEPLKYGFSRKTLVRSIRISRLFPANLGSYHGGSGGNFDTGNKKTSDDLSPAAAVFAGTTWKANFKRGIKALIKGEVTYLTPCGKRLRSYQDADRYLEKIKATQLEKQYLKNSNIKNNDWVYNLNVRNNFSFSSKTLVGTYYRTRDIDDKRQLLFDNNNHNNNRRFLIKYNEKQLLAMLTDLLEIYKTTPPPPSSQKLTSSPLPDNSNAAAPNNSTTSFESVEIDMRDPVFLELDAMRSSNMKNSSAQLHRTQTPPLSDDDDEDGRCSITADFFEVKRRPRYHNYNDNNNNDDENRYFYDSSSYKDVLSLKAENALIALHGGTTTALTNSKNIIQPNPGSTTSLVNGSTIQISNDMKINPQTFLQQNNCHADITGEALVVKHELVDFPENAATSPNHPSSNSNFTCNVKNGSSATSLFHQEPLNRVKRQILSPPINSTNKVQENWTMQRNSPSKKICWVDKFIAAPPTAAHVQAYRNILEVDWNKPTEDMDVIRYSKKLPDFPIFGQGLSLPFESLSQLIMIYEFLQNFGADILKMDSVMVRGITLKNLYKTIFLPDEASHSTQLPNITGVDIDTVDENGLFCWAGEPLYLSFSTPTTEECRDTDLLPATINENSVPNINYNYVDGASKNYDHILYLNIVTHVMRVLFNNYKNFNDGNISISSPLLPNTTSSISSTFHKKQRTNLTEPVKSSEILAADFEFDTKKQTENDVEDEITTSCLYKDDTFFGKIDINYQNDNNNLTIFGKRLRDCDITEDTVSEYTRLYLKLRQIISASSSKRSTTLTKKAPNDNFETEVLRQLELEGISSSLINLKPAHLKIRLLSYLCDEVLACDCLEVEQKMEKDFEELALVRRDKWLNEGHIRKVKYSTKQQIQQHQICNDPIKAASSIIIQNCPAKTPIQTENPPDLIKEMPKTVDVLVLDNELCGYKSKENVDGKIVPPIPIDPPDTITLALSVDYDKEDDETGNGIGNQNHKVMRAKFRRKLFEINSRIRCFTLGQDRYGRRYWVMPYLRALLVEGITQSGDLTKNDIPKEPEAVATTVPELENNDNTKKINGNERFNSPTLVSVANSSSQSLALNGSTNDDNANSIAITNTSTASTRLLPVLSSMLMPLIQNRDTLLELIKSNKEMLDKAGIKVDDYEENMQETRFLTDPTCKNGEKTRENNDLKNVVVHDMINKPVTAQNFQQLLLQQINKIITTKDNDDTATLSSDLLGERASKISTGCADFEKLNSSHIPLTLTPLPNTTTMPKSSAQSLSMDLSSTNTTVTSHQEIPFSPSRLKRIGPEKSLKLTKKYGNKWWYIPDIETIRQLIRCLNLRGVREKMLYKNLNKMVDLLEDLMLPPLTNTEGQKRGRQSIHQVKEFVDYTDTIKRNESFAEESSLIETTKLEELINRRAINSITELENQILASGLNIKGWKSQKDEEEDENDLTNSKMILERLRDKLGRLEGSIDRRYLKSPLHKSSRERFCNNSTVLKWYTEYMFNRKRPKKSGTAAPNLENIAIHDIASTKLNGNLFENLYNNNNNAQDNYYLQQPNKVSVQNEATANSNLQPETFCLDQDTPGENPHTPGLLRWRDTLSRVRNTCQLHICLATLRNSIAWEKSISRIFCQYCHKGNKEDKLLICDGCDKGYHNFCFRPKIDILDGDWYCYHCVSKALGEPICCLCGSTRDLEASLYAARSKQISNSTSTNSKLMKCDKCTRHYHKYCFNPPILRNNVNRLSWKCAFCIKERKLWNRQKPLAPIASSSSSIITTTGVFGVGEPRQGSMVYNPLNLNFSTTTNSTVITTEDFHRQSNEGGESFFKTAPQYPKERIGDGYENSLTSRYFNHHEEVEDDNHQIVSSRSYYGNKDSSLSYFLGRRQNKHSHSSRSTTVTNCINRRRKCSSMATLNSKSPRTRGRFKNFYRTYNKYYNHSKSRNDEELTTAYLPNTILPEDCFSNNDDLSDTFLKPDSASQNSENDPRKEAPPGDLLPLKLDKRTRAYRRLIGRDHYHHHRNVRGCTTSVSGQHNFLRSRLSPPPSPSSQIFREEDDPSSNPRSPPKLQAAYRGRGGARRRSKYSFDIPLLRFSSRGRGRSFSRRFNSSRPVTCSPPKNNFQHPEKTALLPEDYHNGLITLDDCKKILKLLKDSEHSWPFLEPVDLDEFPTYLNFVTRPIDLTTIQSVLENNGYQSSDDVLSDIKLMFENCRLFNEDGSPVSLACKNLNSVLHKSLKSISNAATSS